MTLWSWLEGRPAIDVLPALGMAAILLWQAWSAPAEPLNRSFRSWFLFPFLLLATLIVWRWPQLWSPHELNPDESQFIAGALTLRHDPVFWRSVDGMTSGPLVTYALVPLSWVGLPLDYPSARGLGLLAIWLTFAAAYWHIAGHYQRRAASLGIIAAAFFFAVIVDPDFNHYSSEQVPIALLALSGWLLLRPAGNRDGLWRELVGAALAGLTPWAKLQSAPMGVVLILFAMLRLGVDRSTDARRRGWRLAALVAGGLAPSLLVFAAIGCTGLWTDFYRSYIVQNLLYAHPGSLQALAATSRYLKTDASILGYLTVIVATLATTALAVYQVRRHDRIRFSGALCTGLIWLAVAFGCVLFPGREFLHYTFLLLPPLLFLGGSALGELALTSAGSRRCERAAVAIVFAACGTIALLRLNNPLPRFGHAVAEYDRHKPSQLGSIARLLCRTDPTLAVWGWRHDVYVEAGARQGTRSAYSCWEIVRQPQRDYFRRRYVADFAARRPAVFVDAVGKSTFPFHNRAVNGHETLPALAAMVERDYCLVADLGDARVYARRDLLRRARISQAQIWKAFLAGAPPAESEPPEGEDLNRFPLPKDTLNGHFVMMMRPPASVRLPLRGTERELEIGYGYAPRALHQTSGDGTEFTATLALPGQPPRTVARFRYDPAHHPDRQSEQVLRLLLPPSLKPGSVLTLSTSPGPDGNDAWDWFYVSRIGFVRSPGFLARQFPAFNRPPDFVRAPHAFLTGEGDAVALMLDAPAVLGFRLTGHERTLEFTYGFRTGAELPGRTIGVTFRVVARGPGRVATVVFERKLDPGRNAKDRGEQHAAIALPPLSSGTRLIIQIDPGPSNAWDWTYISTLRLG